MQEISLINYPVLIYCADFLCRGAITVPSYRRLSDFVNDASAPYVTVNDAVIVSWEGVAMSAMSQHGIAVLNKPNIIAVLPLQDAPAPRAAPTEMVPKVPVPVKVLASSLLIEGHWNIARGVDWQRGMEVMRDEFFILTDANVFHLKTNARIHQNLPVILVKRSSIGLFQVRPDASQ